MGSGVEPQTLISSKGRKNKKKLTKKSQKFCLVPYEENQDSIVLEAKESVSKRRWFIVSCEAAKSNMKEKD